jgi:colanic acid/amylovoran biosynthesis glycosyltransferase
MTSVLAAGAAPAGRALRVAYLVNQYPKVSHSFIRREILALERRGVAVLRIALRGWGDALVDPADQAERAHTRYVLQHGLGAPLRAMLALATGRPVRWLAAARLALSMWRRSDRTLFHHLAYLAEACAIVRWLEADRIDHLHAHFGTNPAEVAMLARVLGGPPYSFTVHGPEEFDKPVALGLNDKGARAAFVVAISSYGRSQLFRWLPQAHWPKIEVVHCGLDAAFHASASAQPNAAARLVCVGRLCEQKGQLLLVHALHRLVQQNVPVELVLAGDGEMRSDIEALVDSLGLRSHVRITGWIGSEQVRDEILAARALVLPSFAEGLPVVIMEAMALRRPVITTFVAGIPELVIDRENGWLVPAGDVDALAQAMAACLASAPDELARMGEAARTRVLARHDVDVEAGKLARLFAPRALTGAAFVPVLQ